MKKNLKKMQEQGVQSLEYLREKYSNNYNLNVIIDEVKGL